MKPSNKDVQKYKELYQKRFGIDLNYEDAFKQATQLITLMASAYQPLPADENGLNNFENKDV